MSYEVLTAAAALEQGRNLPWALIRGLSSLTLGPVPKELPPMEELLEAHFFCGQ